MIIGYSDNLAQNSMSPGIITISNMHCIFLEPMVAQGRGGDAEETRYPIHSERVLCSCSFTTTLETRTGAGFARTTNPFDAKVS